MLQRKAIKDQESDCEDYEPVCDYDLCKIGRKTWDETF